MTEILRERNQKFAKAIQTEYEAERVKTQSRYKHLVQERMGVEDMKDAGDKAVQGEAEPKTTADLLKSGDVLLADDTSVADDRLKRKEPTWNYDEIEALIADPGNPVPFAERLPYQAIENLKEDPPKTKKFYRAHFAKQMANIIARAEELLGEEAQHLPEVKLGIEDFLKADEKAGAAVAAVASAAGAASASSVNLQQQQEEEEEDEWAGFSPAQRAIQESRQNVDRAWSAYRYVRSYTTLSDGLVYYTDDKMWPEKLGPAASKIEAEDARARMKKVGNISYKGIIDMPVWKSKRQLREEAAEAKANPQKVVVQEKPKTEKENQEADELVELFMAGKLF